MTINARNARFQPGPTVFIGTLLLSASIAGCGGGGGGGAAPAAPVANQPANNPPAPTLSLAVPGGAYDAVLIDCILAETQQQSCTLNTLPLLAQKVVDPSVDDILGRTVISDNWMSARFRQVLERMPADMLILFNAVTAIVIDADTVVPSYYPLTGAIYISPVDLWLTNAE